ncbi:MAG: glycyl-radical enzyme activating protein, partial [Anaerolineaceae bacterium]|nr:glycyl-radical enzyme activating protein [Anaerolineaceae bacterium]
MLVSQVRGTIFDIRKFSLHDGPGIRTTVFFKGCPLSCWWCHNPESQSFQSDIMLWETRCISCGECVAHCLRGAIVKVEGVDGHTRFITNRGSCTRCGDCIEACTAEAREKVGRRVTVADVLRDVERDRAFYEESGGGVTFSGGEPLAQAEFLQALLEACRKVELHTAVDTSGYAPWSTFEKIIPLTDLFLYDVKLMDEAAHRRFTGVPNGLILSNLQALSARGARIILRLPVIPGINDGADNLREFGEFAARLPHLERVDLLPYHPSAEGKYERLDIAYALHDTQTPSAEHMQEIALSLEPYHLAVTLG